MGKVDFMVVFIVMEPPIWLFVLVFHNEFSNDDRKTVLPPAYFF
jgi:hypothetical protein